MNKLSFLACAFLAVGIVACSTPEEASNAENNNTDTAKVVENDSSNFKHLSEQFADLRIIRYEVPGFEELPLQQKKLLYYLSQAALAGRDIIYDQNYRHNLTIRRTLEEIIENNPEAEKNEDFMVYTKRVWFSNGIHHHYSNDKFIPKFSKEFFKEMVLSVPADSLPLAKGQTPEMLVEKLTPIMFDENFDAKKVELDPSKDLVLESAVNFYDPELTQEEVVNYYKGIEKVETQQPEYGLNTKLVKENGKIVEKAWKVGGMYTEAIEKIVYWLEKAVEIAENPRQKETLQKLIAFYRSGNVEDWDTYNISWVKDTASRVDVVNGYVEVYNDPLGRKGYYESVVSFKDMEATKRIAAIGSEAQWFEDNSPIMDEHKKENVKGITGKVITVVMESGGASPSTPIGINLPNNNWIREVHGSKSVNLGNIVEAYDLAAQEGKSSLTEFAYSEEEIARAKKYGNIADILHTDLHEVIGHASGKINDGVASTKVTLKSYASALEEGRADLVALYYIIDPKLQEIGVSPSVEVGKTSYDSYIKNGLMLQLKRLEAGDDIEEAHMRNRQLIAQWAYDMGKEDSVIVKKIRDGKTYFVITDYQKLRDIFGQQLRELQRIKSEGDYERGKELIEKYGVKVDQELLKEVKERYASLDIAPYGGFINPKLVPVKENGEIVDVKIEYPTSFKEQMMYYADHYSYLPNYN